MAYKDIEVRRKYQREWDAKKRRGETTALGGGFMSRKKLSSAERKEYHNKWNREDRQRKRTEALELFGRKCCLCGRASPEKHLVFHRKDGLRHSLSNTAGLVLKNPKDWALVCRYRCHIGVHFCMNYLGMKWKEIVKF